MDRNNLNKMARALMDINQVLLQIIQETEQDEWIPASEACSRYGLTDMQVRYAGKIGAVREQRMSPRRLLYSADDLERYAGKKAPAAQ